MMTDDDQSRVSARPRRFFRLPSARFWKRFLFAAAAVFLVLSLAGEFLATQLAVFAPSLGIEPRGDALGTLVRALGAIFGAGV